MSLISYIDMNIDKYEFQFKRKPDFYFLHERSLDSILSEKQAYPNPSIIFKDEKSGLYHYKSVWFIPLQDQYLKECLIDRQSLKAYKFVDDKNDWDHKVPIINEDDKYEYIKVRKSVLREFKENIEKYDALF